MPVVKAFQVLLCRKASGLVVALHAAALPSAQFMFSQPVGKAQVGHFTLLSVCQQLCQFAGDGTESQATVLCGGVLKHAHGSPPGQQAGQASDKHSDPAAPGFWLRLRSTSGSTGLYLRSTLRTAYSWSL